MEDLLKPLEISAQGVKLRRVLCMQPPQKKLWKHALASDPQTCAASGKVSKSCTIISIISSSVVWQQCFFCSFRVISWWPGITPQLWFCTMRRNCKAASPSETGLAAFFCAGWRDEPQTKPSLLNPPPKPLFRTREQVDCNKPVLARGATQVSNPVVRSKSFICPQKHLCANQNQVGTSHARKRTCAQTHHARKCKRTCAQNTHIYIYIYRYIIHIHMCRALTHTHASTRLHALRVQTQARKQTNTRARARA